jgi:hypothetical protein
MVFLGGRELVRMMRSEQAAGDKEVNAGTATVTRDCDGSRNGVRRLKGVVTEDD